MTLMFIDYGRKKYQDSESKLIRIDLTDNKVVGWTDIDHPQHLTTDEIAERLVLSIKSLKPDKIAFMPSIAGRPVHDSLVAQLTNDPEVNYQDGNLTYN